MSDPNNENFARDLLGFMVMCGVIGGPALVVAWVILKLFLAIIF